MNWKQRVCIALCLLMWMGTIGLERSFGQTADTSQPAKSTSPLALKKSRGPITISGDNLDINNAQKTAIYTGNVKVVQGEATMFSDKLELQVDQTGKQLEKAVATGNVRLVNGDITATGDQGTFYNTEQKLDLEKNAKVWQGNNTITAARIVAFLETQVLEGYSDPASERATMTVYPQKQSPTPDATPTPGGILAFDQSSAPIAIEADTLKLDNPSQKATYTGNVVAKKGIMEIRADEMIVYITRTKETGDDVDKIEVAGNVRIIQENTTVTGDTGVFLNKEQKAVIEGTAQKKARIEDKTQNMILEAPVIEVSLGTNNIRATQNPKTGPGQRVQTVFEGEPTVIPTPVEGSKKDDSKTNKDDLPSVTLFPGKTPKDKK
jgi:lipopolysaccharide transport protein LptA